MEKTKKDVIIDVIEVLVLGTIGIYYILDSNKLEYTNTLSKIEIYLLKNKKAFNEEKYNELMEKTNSLMKEVEKRGKFNLIFERKLNKEIKELIKTINYVINNK